MGQTLSARTRHRLDIQGFDTVDDKDLDPGLPSMMYRSIFGWRRAAMRTRSAA